MFEHTSLHPIFVHIPLVLLPVAAGFALADFVFPAARLRWAALALLLAGLAGAFLAKQTGDTAAHHARLMDPSVVDIKIGGTIPQVVGHGDLLHTHSQLGEWTRNLYGALAIVEGLLLFATHPAFRRWRRSWSLSAGVERLIRGVWIFVAVGGIGLVVLTGHYGGQLVYNHAVGVTPPHQMTEHTDPMQAHMGSMQNPQP